jgi:hypothetical protein
MFLYIVLIGLLGMAFNLPVDGNAARPAGSALGLSPEGMQALDSRLRVYGEGNPEREAAIQGFQEAALMSAQPQMTTQDAMSLLEGYKQRANEEPRSMQDLMQTVPFSNVEASGVSTNAAGEEIPWQLGTMPDGSRVIRDKFGTRPYESVPMLEAEPTPGTGRRSGLQPGLWGN